MSRENGAPTFLAQSPFGNAIRDPHNRLKFTYTRDFLFSLAKSSSCKLAMEAYLPNLRGFEDAPRLMSPPYGDSDSRHCRSVPQHSAQEVPYNSNHLLHKSDEPYRPPRRYKALPPPLRKESGDTRNNETPMPSDCMNLEKAESEKLRRKGKYPSWSWLQSAGSGIFLTSPASENFNTLVSTANAITEQIDASHKPTLDQGSVRCERLQPSILPDCIKNFSSQQQLERDVTANNTVNLQQKPVNHIDDASQHSLSVLENSIQFKESGAYSNFNEEHPGLEAYRNLKKNKLEVAYDKGLMDSQLNNGSIHDQGSQGSTAKDDVRKAYVSPPVEDKKLLISMVDKCELDMMHSGGISSVHGAKQAVSFSMKQNQSSPNFQIQPELESEFLSGLNESDPSIELSLPDEDNLITFEGPFFMPDEESRAFVDDSEFNPEKNPTEADSLNPTWQMIEKLVEFILDDESSPVSHLGTTVQHKAGLEGFCHSSPHAQPSYTRLSPGIDQQAHDIFNRKSISTTASSSQTHHCFPPNKISQPFPLYHDELRRINHDVSHPMVQMVDPGKLRLCSFCGVQREVTQHRPTYQVTSCTQKLNPILDYTSGYQEASYQCLIMPNPDFPAEGNNNQAVFDSILDIEQRAGHWRPQPHVRGFW